MNKISISDFNNKNLINIYKNWNYIYIIDKYIKTDIHDDFNDKIYSECINFKELCQKNNNKNNSVIHLLVLIDNICLPQERVQLWQYCNTLTYDGKLNSGRNRLIHLFDLCEKLMHVNEIQFNEFTHIIHHNNNIYAIFILYSHDNISIRNLIFNPNININIDLFFDFIQKTIVTSHMVIYLYDSLYDLTTTDKYYIKQLSKDNLYIICYINQNIENTYLTNIKIQTPKKIIQHITNAYLKKIKSKFDEYIIYKYLLKHPIIKKINEYEYIDLVINYKDKSHCCVDNYYGSKFEGKTNILNKIRHTFNNSSLERYEIIHGFYLIYDKNRIIKNSSTLYLIASSDITRDSFVKYMDMICDPITWIDIPSYNDKVINNVNITRDMIISILKYCDRKEALKLRLLNKKFKNIINEYYKFNIKIKHSDIDGAIKIQKSFQNIYFMVHSTDDFTNNNLESLKHIKYLEITNGNITHKGIVSIKDSLEVLNFNMDSIMNIHNLEFIPTLLMLKKLDLRGYIQQENSTNMTAKFLSDETSKFLTNLEELYLPYDINSDNINSEEIDVQSLYNMRSLKKLEIGYINLVGTFSKSLNLISIRINNVIDSNILNILKFCPLLEELFLPSMNYDDYYTNIFKESISYIPKLSVLYYKEMNLSSDDFNEMKNLKYLHVDTIKVCDYFQNLIGLCIENINNNNDNYINLSNFPKLEYYKHSNHYIIKN